MEDTTGVLGTLHRSVHTREPWCVSGGRLTSTLKLSCDVPRQELLDGTGAVHLIKRTHRHSLSPRCYHRPCLLLSGQFQVTWVPASTLPPPLSEDQQHHLGAQWTCRFQGPPTALGQWFSN